jgi:hypothetical protein
MKDLWAGNSLLAAIKMARGEHGLDWDSMDTLQSHR